jgi:hypothetical protein
MHNAVRYLTAAALVSACAVTPALAASSPKRGTYIDPKLQTYIVTTKDVTAIKSFQQPCFNSASGVQGGSFIVSRKIKLKAGGAFSYTGKAKIYASDPDPKIGTVTIKASFKNGKYKGTATFPKSYACKAANFSAKYYGVNPKG